MTNTTSQDDENSLTLTEYLDLEQIAHKQYPWKFNCCFFSQGFVRQPLYICQDCPSSETGGAFCYGCLMNCHASHNVLEIGWKRNSRCTCYQSGQCLFDEPSSQSAAQPASSSIPPVATHNFSGRYCICDSPENGQLMLQCLLCEDWFHWSCLSGPLPSEDQFEDFFCSVCTASTPYLMQNYQKISFDPSIAHSPGYSLFTKTDYKSLVSPPTSCSDHPFDLAVLQYIFHPDQYQPEWSPEYDDDDDKDGQSHLQSIDHSTLIEGIHATNQLTESLKLYLKPFAQKNQIVSKEDILEFFRNHQYHHHK